METLFEELKRYVGWSPHDERALLSLHPHAVPEMERIASLFYDRILAHDGARAALVGGERRVGQLKITLKAWMDKLLSGPWDEDYYQLRCNIGRVHVRIALPQHYMFGAMDVLRRELEAVVEDRYPGAPDEKRAAREALDRILDLELGIMLHTYREDLEAQQARSERLATFGQLIGSIGHELRNPLGVIESSLFILKGRVAEDERGQKHIDRIQDQLKIANDIISALLDMIRDRPLKREIVSLEPLVESVLGSLTPGAVKIEVSGLQALPPVEGDAAQLRQVLLNLADNALHAAGAKGGDAWVRIDGRHLDEGLELTVEDSGPGVDPEILRRLFEPLMTTKAKGIGLGLALVKRIVERHGGQVRYEPKGAGARFVVRLPRKVAHA